MKNPYMRLLTQLPMLGFSTWMLFSLLTSGNQATWKIVFAAIAFIIFFGFFILSILTLKKRNTNQE